MNERTGKILYGSFFAVVLPALLVLWARAAAPNVGLPAVHSPLGWAAAAAGLALVLWATAALAIWGRGLPMNAYPPPVFVARGPYALVAHPIYLGFVVACAGCAVGAGSAAGLWLVTPAAALGCAALVLGYEGPDLDSRFGARPRPLLGLPGCGRGAPVSGGPAFRVRSRPSAVARPLRSSAGARRRAGRGGASRARRGRVARVGEHGARLRLDVLVRRARAARGGDAHRPPPLHGAGMGGDGPDRVPVARAAGRGAAAAVRAAGAARRAPRAGAPLRLSGLRVPVLPRRVGAPRGTGLGAAVRAGGRARVGLGRRDHPQLCHDRDAHGGATSRAESPPRSSCSGCRPCGKRSEPAPNASRTRGASGTSARCASSTTAAGRRWGRSSASASPRLSRGARRARRPSRRVRGPRGRGAVGAVHRGLAAPPPARTGTTAASSASSSGASRRA